LINLVPTPNLFDVALRNAFVGNFDNINQRETKRAIHSRKSKGGRRRDFHLSVQLESVQNDGEFTRTIIKNVIVLPLEVHCEANTPWGDSHDMTTFELRTRQQVVVEKTAQQYNDPRLALIGAFLYKSIVLLKGLGFWTLLLILYNFKSCVSSENNINKLGSPT
jgi:hypothetical protein